MSDQDNINAIKNHIETFGKGDIAAICAQVTTDVEWIPPLSDGIIPYNRPWKGREGVEEYFTMLFEVLEWKSFEAALLIAAEGDRVLLLGKEDIVIRDTGKLVHNEFLALFKLRDGLISEFRLCENTELVSAAFPQKS